MATRTRTNPLSILVNLLGGIGAVSKEMQINYKALDSFVRRDKVTAKSYIKFINYVLAKGVMLDEKQKEAILTGLWDDVSIQFIKNGSGNETA